MKATLLLPWLLSTVAFPSFAAATLPKIFSDHAVLQRDLPIHIWGWSEPGETVSVSFDSAKASATGDRLGHWSVYLPSMPAGGPYKLTVNELVRQDVMVGDVWFASGQSNMEMPLKGFPGSAVVKNADEEIRNSDQPHLRLLLIPKKPNSFPLQDFDGDVAWTTCTPETAAKFSAVAYFFGREIAERENVTVGLIDSTWGGTPGEAWVSLDSLSADAGLMPVFATWAKMDAYQADVPAMKQAEKTENDAAQKEGKPIQHAWHPDPGSYDPSWLYNGMVAPATPYAIKGVIWYQGETNSAWERAPHYYRVFSTLIADWRKHWAQGDFPFLFAQISSFKSNDGEGWGVVRDAQMRTTLSVPNVGMAVTIDVGDPNNVHPSDKQTVGHRLALNARSLAYGETLEYSGPLYRQAIVDGTAIRISFTHAKELVSKGDLAGFEIAGADHKFVPATAGIENNAVVVRASGVDKPVYVRYAWPNAPQANLFNQTGLPASTFTSE